MAQLATRRPTMRSIVLISTVVAIVTLFTGFDSASADDQDWIIGRWELVYDPEDRATDWLEFLPNGDVRNIWADGTEVSGIYIVTAEGVKAVLNYEGTDIIFTFHADEARRSLRIVTSNTGLASVYQRLAPGK